MKKVEFEVKNKGTSLGKISCPVYESMEEVQKAGIKGDYILQSVNRCVRKDARDGFYASKTQSVSVVGQARKVMKDLGEAQQTAMQKDMEALLKRYAK